MEEKNVEKEKEEEKSSFLIPREKYLETGIHIGTRFKTSDMKKFIFKMRDDGLYILDLRKIDERIREAAKIMAQYKPEDIMVVASRLYSGNAAEKFSKLTGVGLLKGRFVPGTMTNVNLPNFKEPKLLFVCDPKGEGEAIREASMTGVPLIALCDTDNGTRYVDWIVPANNKGRRSLAAVFYLLTRELLMNQGKISSYDEFEYRLEQFERFEEEKREPEKKEEGKGEGKEETNEEKGEGGSEDERAKKALAGAKEEKKPKKAAAPAEKAENEELEKKEEKKV
ncbi:30S ribosomal protein S2 [Candidatus Micrarchaeota archaeon]|nr:30S ribosomal protein S2 [Candidatus Micrarchaeota archaeon]